MTSLFAVDEPMEAKSAAELPEGEGWWFEPKWDGFRCLVFKDGEEVRLQAKSGKPLTRYFPEVVEAVRKARPKRFILDGELLVAAGGAFSFEALQMRLHPAQSRIDRLARETPAVLTAFDLLLSPDGRDLRGEPLKERRRLLALLIAEIAEAWVDPHAGRGGSKTGAIMDRRGQARGRGRQTLG